MKSALRKLVALFPAVFRERFGAGMIDDIERDYDRARARGILAAAWCAAAIAWDVVRSAIAEHLSPTWVRARPPLTEGPEMRWSGRSCRR